MIAIKIILSFASVLAFIVVIELWLRLGHDSLQRGKLREAIREILRKRGENI